MATRYSRSRPISSESLPGINVDPAATFHAGVVRYQSLPIVPDNLYATISRAQRVRYSKIPQEFRSPTDYPSQPSLQFTFSSIESVDREPAENAAHLSTEEKRESGHVPVNDGRMFSELIERYKGDSCSYWKAFSRYFSDSLFQIPLHFILIGMMASIIYVAITYRNQCRMNELIPLLLGSIGIVGISATCMRMLYVIWKRISPSARCLEMRYVTYGAMYVFFVMFMIEVGLFFSATPSFERKDGNFCHPFFYTFVYGMNWAILFLMFLLFLVHGPTFLE